MKGDGEVSPKCWAILFMVTWYFCAKIWEKSFSSLNTFANNIEFYDSHLELSLMMKPNFGICLTIGFLLFYFRHKDFGPSSVCPSRSGYPPWNLKRGGLESSGQRLISSIGKTKRRALFFFNKQKKNLQKFLIFWGEKRFLTDFYPRFFQIIWFSGLGLTGELWSNAYS